MNEQTKQQGLVMQVPSFNKYGGDQEDKVATAAAILRKRSEYFGSMEEEEAVAEVEGVASASGYDVDDPNTTAYDIVQACLNKNGKMHIEDDSSEEE